MGFFPLSSHLCIFALLTSLQESWNEQFDALVDYVRKHGHAKVAKRERSLGRWVCSQRTRVSQGKMTLERFIGLEAVGFVWASQTPTQNFIVQIEKMREQAMEKLQSDPVARQRFSELQAKVSRDFNMHKSMDNIQQAQWGNVLSSHVHHTNMMPAAVPTVPPSGMPTASPPQTATPSLAFATPPDPAKGSPKAASDASSFSPLSAKAGNDGTSVEAKPAAIEASETQTQETTAPSTAVDGTEEGAPYVAFSMKSAACEMEATAQKADIVSKDMLRAKAAALRAAAEEIEAIANAEDSSPSSDAKFAQV